MCVGLDLQSEGFLVEAVVVLDLVQGLFFERSFDPVQNVVHVMFLRPECIAPQPWVNPSIATRKVTPTSRV